MGEDVDPSPLLSIDVLTLDDAVTSRSVPQTEQLTALDSNTILQIVQDQPVVVAAVAAAVAAVVAAVVAVVVAVVVVAAAVAAVVV